MFCNFLWMLDEYWYYSMMSFGMIFMFEGTVVTQRLQNMKRLRSMRIPPQELFVRRMGRWVKIMSDDLYPGDIVLLKKPSNQKTLTMPCDMLIVSGSAVVNESILTGESQPLVKEGVGPKDDQDELLDLKTAAHKSHVLYGGTEVLQMLTAENSQEYEHLGILPVDKGSESAIICYVIKNGFETKQGKLMRTILFSSDRVSAESKETYYFLLILLCFALCSSYYVTTESLKDPDRSRYKILLRCIMIITNVVPPELPMELSMAVNYSIL